MIVLQNVFCGYHNKEILKNISFTIKPNALTCLLGKNGVGKTTLFKTILGLLPIIKGNIMYEGKRKNEIAPKNFAKLISYVPQAHNTPFPFKVIDVVVMGQYAHSQRMMGAPDNENRKVALQCIETLGINKLTHRKFSELSGGEKQMVLIARAMAQQPKYIAMDEPTANLDMGNRVQVLQTVNKLKGDGYGVLMNTHSPQQALQYANKVVLLKEGKLKAEGDPTKVLNTGSVSELYNTPIEIIDAYSQSGERKKVLIHP